jgi:hypothetical protein
MNCKLGKREYGSGYPNFQRPRINFHPIIAGGNVGGPNPTTGISMTTLKTSRLVIVCGHGGGHPRDLECSLIGDPEAEFHVRSHLIIHHFNLLSTQCVLRIAHVVSISMFLHFYFLLFILSRVIFF